MFDIALSALSSHATDFQLKVVDNTATIRNIAISDTGIGSILDGDSSINDDTSAYLNWRPSNEPGTGGRIDSTSVSPYDSNHVLVGGDILGARVSTDQANGWSVTSGWLNYEIADFTWDPNNPKAV